MGAVDETTEWETLVRADRDCRVFWGHSVCRLERGHAGGHVSDSGSRPEPGFMFGEDATDLERAELI